MLPPVPAWIAAENYRFSPIATTTRPFTREAMTVVGTPKQRSKRDGARHRSELRRPHIGREAPPDFLVLAGSARPWS